MKRPSSPSHQFAVIVITCRRVERQLRSCLLLVCVLFGATGCFHVRAINPAAALDEIETIRSEKTNSRPTPKVAKIMQRTAFTITAPRDLGCIMVESTDPANKALGDLNCTAFPIMGGDAEEIIKQRKEGVDSRMGMHVKNFAEVAKVLLRAHLSERFADPSIVLGAPRNAEVLKYFQHSTRFGKKVVVVELRATDRSGTQLLSRGRGDFSYSAGNVGWSIPVMILTFPIGVPFVNYALDAGESGTMERSFVQALDAAARDMSEQLAAQGGGRAWSIEVSMGTPGAPPVRPATTNVAMRSAHVATPVAGAGCRSDVQCKGARICTNRRCVNPAR